MLVGGYDFSDPPQYGGFCTEQAVVCLVTKKMLAEKIKLGVNCLV